MNIIDVIWIGREEKDEYYKIEEHFKKLSSRYGKVTIKSVWSREIQKRHNSGNRSEIEESYTTALQAHLLKDNFNIILDPTGKDIDTEKFADILQKNPKVSFFIGGAYGFNNSFRKNGDLLVKLSSLTTSHKIAKVVLLEQIYRALTINGGHPYHK
jgi:23S rRNA (pseudouridine1915-N3)-methyltransferase